MGVTPASAYLAICAGVCLFQVALIAGAPWGELTQGGRHKGALGPAGRIAAVVSIGVIAAMCMAVLSDAGGWPNWPRWTAWAVLGVQCLSTLMNWITPSVAERRLWGPITTVMLALVAYEVLL